MSDTQEVRPFRARVLTDLPVLRQQIDQQEPEGEAEILVAVFGIPDTEVAVGNTERQIIDRGAFQSWLGSNPFPAKLYRDHGAAIPSGIYKSAELIGSVRSGREIDEGLVISAFYNLRKSVGRDMFSDLLHEPNLVEFSFASDARRERTEIRDEDNFEHVVEMHPVEFCLDPETRVLRTDLTWSRIGDVCVGDEVVGFDEDLRQARHRPRLRGAVVEHTATVVRDCYRITLDDGREVIASADHRWVAKGTPWSSDEEWDGLKRSSYGTANLYKWVRTADLVPGKSQISSWVRPWDEVPPEKEREAGWLAGFADGEGWLSETNIGFGQNPGVAWDELWRCLKELDFEPSPPRQQSSKSPCLVSHLFGYANSIRFLGQVRPVRLLEKSRQVWENRQVTGRTTGRATVVKLDHLGERETIGITTSTKTFIAEGLMSHNSQVAEAAQKETRLITARARTAIASHSSPTSDAPWNGPKNEAAYPAEAAVLRAVHAWRDPEGDADAKSTYKFNHHFASGRAASTRACSAGIAILNGGRGGANIPDSDRAGVHAHLGRHLKDADMAVPPLRSAAWTPDEIGVYLESKQFMTALGEVLVTDSARAKDVKAAAEAALAGRPTDPRIEFYRELFEPPP